MFQSTVQLAGFSVGAGGHEGNRNRHAPGAAWAQLGGVAASIGIHALAVGATAGPIVGMMTRTARGHTGRPLKVSRLEVAAYLLVVVAAVARVLRPLVLPAHTRDGWVVAALARALAFALYLLVYTPWLLSSRLDGKDG